MEINVNGNIVEWKSDFNPKHFDQSVRNGWKVSSGDYFKFPVKIAGVDLIEFFVKRFEKEREEISGYDFIEKVKGKKITGLPVVFDLVKTIEAGHTIFYLFTEYIPGDTLDILQERGFTFLPSKLGKDLFDALQSIHERGFWFPDFDPKNLFRSEKGDFFVIDLDSIYPLTVLPSRAMFCSQDYWVPVYDYYMENEGFLAEDVKKIRGDLLNHLSLIYLMGLYSFYVDGEGEDMTAHSIARLNKYLLERDDYFRPVMTYCFNKIATSNKFNQDVLTFELFKSVMETVIFREDFERNIFGTSKMPEIVYFKANGQSKGVAIRPHSKVVFEWETKNTTSIRLLPENRLLANTGTLELSPYKDTIYSIHAVSKCKNLLAVSDESIDLDIFDPDVAKPILDEFIIDGCKEKRTILLENTSYSVKWKTKYAQKVFLDGKKVANDNIQTFTAPKRGSQITHSLKAINTNNGKSKKSEAILEIFTERKPEINFSIEPLTVKSGKSVMLTWAASFTKNISILKNDTEIGTDLKDPGSMNIPLTADKKGSRIQFVRFTAFAYSQWGSWPSDPREITVTVIRPRTLWIIILIVIAISLIIAGYIYSHYFNTMGVLLPSHHIQNEYVNQILLSLLYRCLTV